MDMDKVLINNNQYAGKYIAISNLKDTKIIGSGKDPEEALNEARKKKVPNPFILYVPDKDMVQIS